MLAYLPTLDFMRTVRGSGNVYRDFGRSDAGLAQARALLASQIIRVLDSRSLSARQAERVTGVTYSEFSRIRNAKLSRFTLDRLIGILGKLDETVEVSVRFSQRRGSDVAQQAL
jgi:predicted XRE-type DNA-binding protein